MPALAFNPARAWVTGTEQPFDEAGLAAWVDFHLASAASAVTLLTSTAGPRTIANTLEPYDQAVAALSTAGSQAGLLHSVHPEKSIRDTAEASIQRVAIAATALSLNQDAYNALAALENSPEFASADAPTRYYLSRTLLQYRIAGVDKDAGTRDHIRQLHERATELSLVFGRNVQESRNSVTVNDLPELDGLPGDYIEKHPPASDRTITLTTDFPDYSPVMTFAASADLRRRMMLAYQTRAYPANKQVLLDLLAVRQQIATTLGFKSWADLATADQMMHSAANMQNFLDLLDAASTPLAAREYAMVLAFAQSREPQLTALDSASAGYWYEQYRRTAFEFDSQSVRPYLPYHQVQHGVLDTAARLFHVNFRTAADAALWHPAVTAWDVFDRRTEQPLGRFYLDMHPREGKDKWFSAYPLLPGIADRQLPEAALICNFPGGPLFGSNGESLQSNDPGLLQYSDVVTYFHEFGHLMHALLGGHQRWAGQSGIATESDFVEVPSQMLEEFFRSPAILQSFARHYQTGEVLSNSLIERMNRASAFGRANFVRTQLFYTTYSLDLHNQDPATIDLDQILHDLYTRFLPYTWIDGNRMYASFGHLCGYSSNYYTYLYDKVIALDFFNQFDLSNLVTGEAALRYRSTVLQPGGSIPANDLVHSFLGRSHTLDAFSKWLGEALEDAE